jgi:hypothetical protein
VKRIAIWVALLSAPTTANADWQLSARLGAGGGVETAPTLDREARFEMMVRSELLLGPHRVRQVRFGPALELRTAGFETAEAAGGLAISIPVLTAAPLVLTAGAGWASRPADGDAAFAMGIVAWGFRPYNHFSRYGFALQVYAAARHDLSAPDVVAITAGVEVDLLFLTVIPGLLLYEWITGGDPDEPD